MKLCMRIIKRDGSEATFDVSKIISAVSRANNEVSGSDKIRTAKEIEVIAESVQYLVEEKGSIPSIEDVQEYVISELQRRGYYVLARKYIRYMEVHKLMRSANTTDAKLLSLVDGNNEEAKQENANKNPVINSTQRDYMAGEVSKDLTRRYLLPPDIVTAHEEGIIHFHDMDYYAQHMHNCDLVNMDDMLQNGTVITGTTIDRPKLFSTACNITTQVIAQVASVQYGGQTVNIGDLVPFVDVSRQRFKAHVLDELAMTNTEMSEDDINRVVEARVLRDVKRGVKLMQYQVLTLMTTNGQTPFITMVLDITSVPEHQQEDAAIVFEEVLRQRIRGVKNKQGVWVTPAFPKLVYILDECNIREESKFWCLTELAAECTAKRMVPDYISAKMMRELKGDVYPCMGCRSFLTPDDFTDKIGNIANAGNYVAGEHKYYGRFNQGVVTINLVDVALSARKAAEEGGGNVFDLFWKIYEERLALCHRALQCRHNRLKGTLSDVAPILWQYGAIARLQPGEKIDKLLYNGYSTISLGYAGLYECVKAMTGRSHTDPEAKEFALQVMQLMNDKCKLWKEAENIAYSVYGTPLESTTYKFAKCLQKRFGKVEGITDHDYITNSYHVNVREPIDAFTKLKFEAEFQKLSPGGAISYVEVPNMCNNLSAVLDVIKFIYDNIMYAELNTKSDYCQVCQYDGEIKIVEDNGKLIWECPNCGNRDQSKMNVARRTCGYIGTQFWNQGRTQEIRDRVIHLGV